LNKSAIILAGGFSRRFGQDKGLLQLANKPLVKHVLDAVDTIVDEKMLVVSSKIQAETYAKVVSSNVNVLVDVKEMYSPLVGAVTGFEKAGGTYSLLLPCDTPFISREVITLLFELCINKNAVIPRWPNGYIEPLQVVYCTKHALEAARKALSEGELNMWSMVGRILDVRYVSTIVLQQLDPKLKTFFNINTLMDLKKAELMFRRKL